MPPLPPIVMLAGIWAAALAGAVLSAAALFVSGRQSRAVRRWVETEWAGRESASQADLGALTERLEALAAELRGLKEQTQQNYSGPLASRTTGLDLTRRAQALRMHRRGDPPDQIAAMLKVPFQEVDLLLKVQRIVLDHI